MTNWPLCLWRAYYRIAYPIAQLWWRLTAPAHEGALVALFTAGNLLIVKPSYRPDYNLPGGGLGAGETPEQAALRELQEEIGLSNAQLRYAGAGQGRWNGRRETVHYFEAHFTEPPKLTLDGREIIAAEWVNPDTIDPSKLSGAARYYLAMWKARNPSA